MFPELRVYELCCRCIYWGWGHHGPLFVCLLTSCDFSAMIIICCKEKLLWGGSVATLTDGNMDNSLECIWELCSFSKVVMIGSPQRSMTSLSWGSWLGLQHPVFSNRDLPSASEIQPSASLYCFGSLLDSSNQQLERGLLMLGIWGVSYGSWKEHCQSK